MDGYAVGSKIIIADKDINYSLALGDYLTRHYPGNLEVVTFTKEIDILDYYEKTDSKAELILLHESFNLARKKLKELPLLIILNECDNDIPFDGNCIFKYQCGAELLKQIIGKRTKFVPGAHKFIRENKAASVVAVCSGAGGTGKTLLALSLSIQAALEGKKVFYLNLEDIASTELFLSSESLVNISGVLYYLKHSQDKELLAKIANHIAIDREHRVHFFKAADNILDIKEDLENELAVLIDVLLNAYQYERIFIDMPSGINKNSLPVLWHCNHVLLVCTEDDIVNLKTALFIKELKMFEDKKGCGLLERTRIILNKHKEDVSDEHTRKTYCDRDVFYTIPHTAGFLVKQDKNIKSAMNGAFGTGIYRIYRDLCL